MRHSRLLRVLSAAACVALYPAQPATAGRTVVDGGALFSFSGYCSPGSANTSDCSPYTLPSAIQLGGTTYNSFWVNSNGTVSLASIESFLAPQNTFSPPPPQGSLAEYSPIPIFSPAFSDGQGYFDFASAVEYWDGNYVARTTLAPATNSFTVDWYFCSGTLSCGPRTVKLVTDATFDPNEVGNFGGLVEILMSHSTLNDPGATDLADFLSGQQFLIAEATGLPVYTMTLTDLLDGFQVDYTYNQGATGDYGSYGFNLPTAQLENFGPLQNRTFIFNAFGALVSGVPEPATWMSMLLGFGLAGFALRRQRRLQVPA